MRGAVGDEGAAVLAPVASGCFGEARSPSRAGRERGECAADDVMFRLMWTDELQSVRTHFQEVGREHREEMYRAWLERRVPFEVWRRLADEGYFAAITENRLGYRRGLAWYAAASEGFGYGSRDPGFNIGPICHAAMAIPLVDRWGSREVRERYLDRMISADVVAAFAVTEKGGVRTPESSASTSLRRR